MSKSTVWTIVGLALIVTVVGIIAAARSGGALSTNQPAVNATTAPAITSADHTAGNPAAKVTVIEYGDYQCPACGAWSPIYAELIKDYGDRVLFAFRNFPLYQIHPNAQISSEAAEAAGLQGKFWEMHDMLYAKQTDWADTPTGSVVANYFDKYAAALGLNVSKFNADLNSAAVQNKIQTDVSGGNAAQIDHTPTFFLNLTQIANPANYLDFKSVLDKALSA